MIDFTDRVLDLRLEKSRITYESAVWEWCNETDNGYYTEAGDTDRALARIQDSIKKDFGSIEKYLTDKKKMIKYDKNRAKKLTRLLDHLNTHAQVENKRKYLYTGFDPKAYTKTYTDCGNVVANFKKKVCGLKTLEVEDREKLDAAKEDALKDPKRTKDYNAIEYGRTLISFTQAILDNDESNGPKNIDQMCKLYIDALEKMKGSADPDVMDVADSIRYVAMAEVAILRAYAKWRNNLIREVTAVDASIFKNANDERPVDITLIHTGIGIKA